MEVFPVIIEVLITLGVVAFAVYMIYNSFKKKALGECGCGSCNESKKNVVSD